METTATRGVATGSPVRPTSILTRQRQGDRAGGLQEAGQPRDELGLVTIQGLRHGEPQGSKSLVHETGI